MVYVRVVGVRNVTCARIVGPAASEMRKLGARPTAHAYS